ncbi:MAG TPA: FtsX-like permease family protein [Vicinamibacterales bacterium]
MPAAPRGRSSCARPGIGSPAAAASAAHGRCSSPGSSRCRSASWPRRRWRRSPSTRSPASIPASVRTPSSRPGSSSAISIRITRRARRSTGRCSSDCRRSPTLLRPLADPIGWDYPFTIEGQTPEVQATNPHANYEAVSPGYFTTVGIPLVEGRLFDDADTADAAPVAIVSASMARRFWPGERAIGKRLKAGSPSSTQPWKTVVGVVGDVRYREWTAVRADFYVPYTQWNFPRMDLVVRARPGGDPLRIVPAVRAVVRDADPEIALASVTTMARAVEEATAGPRFTAVLLSALALIALVVAAVGAFSVLAWSVERRMREIGVRVALGARRRDILGLVLRQAGLMTAAGVVAGLAAALAGGRALAGLLYGISPHDPATLAATVLLLVLVGLGGGLLASRRALAVQPAEALREE